MILTGDYHTHTPFSHGKNTVEENVERAKELGLKELGIADHGFSHVAFGIRRRQVKDYVSACKKAGEKYGVKVLVGIEANVLGASGKADLKASDYDNFDLYLCGKHVFVWYDKFSDFLGYGCKNFLVDKFGKKPSDKLVRRNTFNYVQTIRKNPIDAVTHLNYLCRSNALEVAKCAADYGTYIELNSKKQHLSDEELISLLDTNARFVIDSDAHSKDRVGEIELVKSQLERVNFPLERIDNIDGRTPSFRFSEYKKRL